MTGRFSPLAAPAASLCTPGCPLSTCCAPDIPLQLAFSPHCPAFLSSLLPPGLSSDPQPRHVYLHARLSCCCAFCHHLVRCTAPSCSLVAFATLALLLQLLSAELGSGREAYHALIGAVGNLWAPIAVGRAALHGNPFPCPSSAVSPIILGSSLRPLPFSLGLSPCPAFRQASDLAFYITEKIEAFNLHPLSQ